MKKLLLGLVLGLSLSVQCGLANAQNGDESIVNARPTPEKSVQDACDAMLGAIADNDYTGFLAIADDDFKAALSKPLFKVVVDSAASRLKKGYKSTYLDSINKRGFKVHLWKLSFKDKGDDMIVELSWKDGKVGGFFLR